jgi:hypothetical protein
MGLLSPQEAIVWLEFQKGKATSTIAEELQEGNMSPAYTSRVLNRARAKISKALRDHAASHRLDVESLQDYKGLLIGFDYQANTEVYIVYTEKLGIIVWYQHNDFNGKPCEECPKDGDCLETLETIINEYNIELRLDEEVLPLTQQAAAVFRKLAAKEIPRYKRVE